MTPKEIAGAFGAWLRALRGLNGLSVEGLAHRSGVAVDRIQAIERARHQPPSLDEVSLLLTAIDPAMLPRLLDLAASCAVLGVSIDQASVTDSVSRMAASLGVLGSSPVATAFADLAESVARVRARSPLNS